MYSLYSFSAHAAVEIAYGDRKEFPFQNLLTICLQCSSPRRRGKRRPVCRSDGQRVHFDPSVGTEELGHLEMIGAIVHQLTRDLSMEQIKKAGFDAYFVDHTTGVYPTAASGFPWSAASMAVKGDVITDLSENMAAEQKARTTYDNILRLSDDPDVNDVIRFLREREVVHYQRFGEGLRRAIEKMDQKNFYAVNPAFDRS